MPELILASTSPARRALMDALGLPYRALAPDYAEDPSLSRDPVELARALARGKAAAVSRLYPGAWVLGADQVCAFEGEIWGKPRDAADAREKLERLSGKTHRLITGVALLGPNLDRVEHDVVELEMYPLTRAEVTGYLATREWEGCAGGYRVEERGQALFARIAGDLTSVRGLPMLRVVRLLREAGMAFFG
jgi:septum formation protein